MGIEVKIVDPVDIFEEAKDMMAANWRESGVPIEFNAEDTRAFYMRLKIANMVFSADVKVDGQRIGYSVVTIVPHPLNASVRICNVDGLYLLPEYRGSSAFARLMDAIEQLAREHKVNLIHLHAPTGSVFAQSLATRYTPLSSYFYKELKYTGIAALEGQNVSIAPMSEATIAKVRNAETLTRDMPQVPIDTSHVIHAGVYARTVMIPAGIFLTGALIKRATMLIISGHVAVTIGDEAAMEFEGYNIIAASANRKQAYVAITDTYITMLFATNAQTVEEAEFEFTDESDLLISRDPSNVNTTTITGE